MGAAKARNWRWWSGGGIWSGAASPNPLSSVFRLFSSFPSSPPSRTFFLFSSPISCSDLQSSNPTQCGYKLSVVFRRCALELPPSSTTADASHPQLLRSHAGRHHRLLAWTLIFEVLGTIYGFKIGGRSA